MISSSRRTQDPGIHLLLFHTEGPPNDLGLALAEETHRLVEVTRDTFDSVRVHTPRSLIAGDPTWAETLRDRRDWVRSHPDFRADLKWNENWAALGFLAWKPRLLWETLHDPSVRPGDVVFYHDSNVTKYPVYLQHAHRWARFVRARARTCDVLLFSDDLMDVRADTKQELLDRYRIRLPASFTPHINATMLSARKTPTALRFVEHWMDVTNDIDNVSPLTRSSTYKDYVWNSQEQATLFVTHHHFTNSPEPGPRMRIVGLRGSRQVPPRTLFSIRTARHLLRRHMPRAAATLGGLRRALWSARGRGP